jgi:hypothetical protein
MMSSQRVGRRYGQREPEDQANATVRDGILVRLGLSLFILG